jgi:sugar phosphate isomerase/epimerase
VERRQFIRTAGLAAAFAATGCAGKMSTTGQVSAAVAATNGSGRSIESIGLQLYTVRTLMAENVRDTLELVAAAGYNEVEFAGYFEHTPTDIRAMMDDVGLRSPSSHVSLEALQEDADRQFEIARVLGQEYVVIPWIAPELRGDLDGYRRVAATFNGLGERAQSAGLQLAYHNHEFEFEPMGGVVPYDVLLEEADAELVKMQLDLFWIWIGAQPASTYISQDPERFVSCHVKDGWADGEQSIVGQGDLDFATDFAAGSFRHYFVENDQPEDPAAFIRASADYLKQLTW